jgi:Fe2+ transport system protein FeoA
MSFTTLAFSSRATVALSAMAEDASGVVVEVLPTVDGRADRLLALGVTPGARIVVLQTLPGIVFRCDQTELAVERSVAHSVIVRPQENRS